LWFSPQSPAAEGPEWFADRAQAAKQASQQDKLLLAVDMAGDSSVNTSDSADGSLYRSLAMGDRRVREFLASRYVVTFRQVGSSSPGFAVAFICLPSQRVLHFVPGLVSSAELLQELTWAAECNGARLRASPAEKEWFVREQHLAAANRAHLKAFQKRHGSKWHDGFQTPATQTRNDLLAVIRDARAVRDQLLLARLQTTWTNPADHGLLLTALASHGGLEPVLAHLVLSEFPLVPLAELEQPLFEFAAGEKPPRIRAANPGLSQGMFAILETGDLEAATRLKGRTKE
jgi:hypothetical protein